jgi:zeta-carotene desaturase
VGLSKLAARAADYIRDRGGRMLLGKGAKSLLIEGDRIRGVGLSDGRILNGDLFISALPPEVLSKMLPEGWRAHPFFVRATKLRWNPIVNLHLWFDRPVMEEDFVAFLDSPVQWVFNRNRILGRPGPGQYLCLSLSGAWELIDLPPERVLQKLLRELEQLFPHVGKAKLEKYLVTRQHRATISLAPGMEEHRLPPRTPIENLFLAGDWTDTGWPSTMEGAVRSGIECARSLSC